MRGRFRKLSERQWLIGIVTLGFLLRLLFVLKGATTYYGAGQEHINGDSFSFIQSFRNLWHTGHYTSDPLLPEASFGRLPGYPFFYGLHYLIVGPVLVVKAVVISQMLLDTAAITLIYKILRRWSSAGPALVAALLYATYPFVILWVTVLGSETLSVFCTLLWLALITRPAGKKKHYWLVGVLAAVAFYVREYLGILLPISILFVATAKCGSKVVLWQRSLFVLLGFGLLYVWWPIRNYANHGQLMLLKPASAGYINQREDMQAYLDWLACWTNDNSSWMEAMLLNQPYRYPADIFSGPVEERQAYILTALAANCGSSFQVRRTDGMQQRRPALPYSRPCNARIAAGFDSLRESFIARMPWKYHSAVPLANLQKAFFKNETIKPGGSYKQYVHKGLFVYRSSLLLFAVVGLGMYRRKAGLWPIAAYTSFIYWYMSFVFRSLEMRYLLQADVLMLLPAALVIGHLAGGKTTLHLKESS